MGYLKYKIKSYKPTQKWQMSCATFGNDFYLGALSSFDYVFTLVSWLRRKYHLNVHVRERGSTFAKCIVYEFLKDDIQSWKNSANVKEQELKQKKHNKH
jgi:hypothetical protein